MNSSRKDILKKLGVSSALVGIIGTTGAQFLSPIIAKAEIESTVEEVNNINLVTEDFDLTPLYDLIQTGVFSEFAFNESGQLILNISIEEATEQYQLSESQTTLLSDILEQWRNLTGAQNLSANARLHISGVNIYFTNYDVKMYLSSVIMMGPAAVVAAITAATTLIGTPIAGAIAAVVGSFSAFAICATVQDALMTGKGFYIGLTGWGTW